MHNSSQTFILAKKKMMNIKQSTFILLATLFIFLMNSQAALAQDTGAPAMENVTYFTLGGAAAGAALGAAYWMLDPLSPSADLTNSSLQGFAVGSILGMILGIMQLQKQMVLPYREPEEPMEEEFDGNARLLKKQGLLFGKMENRPGKMPVFQIQLNF